MDAIPARSSRVPIPVESTAGGSQAEEGFPGHPTLGSLVHPLGTWPADKGRHERHGGGVPALSFSSGRFPSRAGVPRPPNAWEPRTPLGNLAVWWVCEPAPRNCLTQAITRTFSHTACSSRRPVVHWPRSPLAVVVGFGDWSPQQRRVQMRIQRLTGHGPDSAVGPSAGSWSRRAALGLPVLWALAGCANTDPFLEEDEAVADALKSEPMWVSYRPAWVESESMHVGRRQGGNLAGESRVMISDRFLRGVVPPDAHDGAGRRSPRRLGSTRWGPPGALGPR